MQLLQTVSCVALHSLTLNWPLVQLEHGRHTHSNAVHWITDPVRHWRQASGDVDADAAVVVLVGHTTHAPLPAALLNVPTGHGAHCFAASPASAAAP